jgi:hypothetical protein
VHGYGMVGVCGWCQLDVSECHLPEIHNDDIGITAVP